MAMPREVRNALHKKQERFLTGEGVPDVEELKEGAPVLRLTEEGLVQYVRHNSVLYKNVLTLAASVEATAIPKPTHYAIFGSQSYNLSGYVLGTHHPLPFVNGGTSGQVDTDFGTGTDPDNSFTTANTDTQYASQIVSMMWRLPDAIKITSVTSIEGADNATGDTTRMHLKSFTFTSGSTTCLAGGVLLAHNSDVTNAGNEQAYLSTWTVDSADVAADKVILAFFRSDSINSDYSISVTVRYTLAE